MNNKIIPDKYAKASNFLNVEHPEAEAAEIPFAAAAAWWASPSREVTERARSQLSHLRSPCSPRPRNRPPPHLPLGPWGCVLGCRAQPGGSVWRERLPPSCGCVLEAATPARWGPPGRYSASLRLAARARHSLAVCVARARCHRGAPPWRAAVCPQGHQTWRAAVCPQVRLPQQEESPHLLGAEQPRPDRMERCWLPEAWEPPRRCTCSLVGLPAFPAAGACGLRVEGRCGGGRRGAGAVQSQLSGLGCH